MQSTFLLGCYLLITCMRLRIRIYSIYVYILQLGRFSFNKYCTVFIREEKNIIEHLHNFLIWTSLKIKYPGSNKMNEYRKQNSCIQRQWYLIVCAGHALKSSLRPCILFCHLRMPRVIFAEKSKIRPGRPELNRYYYCCLLLKNYLCSPNRIFTV